MKIGELAKTAGCTVETIRYYEREGLLDAPLRNEQNNYRHYTVHHLDRLTFIRRCRTLDMTHEEIRALLQAKVRPDDSCEAINELIEDHLMHVQSRIAELQALALQLKELRGQCVAAHTTSDCGILRELTHPQELQWQHGLSADSHLDGSHCQQVGHHHRYEK